MHRHGLTSYLRLVIALLAVVGALGYLNWRLMWFTPDATPIAPRAASDASTASAGGVLDLDQGPAPRNAAEFPQTVRRPLFFANRRPVDMSQPMAPVVAKPAPEAAALATLEQAQLVGIMRTGKAKARALIRTGTDGQGVWVGVGDNVRGWQLKEIGDDKAVFEANGQRVQVKLYPATAVGAK